MKKFILLSFVGIFGLLLGGCQISSPSTPPSAEEIEQNSPDIVLAPETESSYTSESWKTELPETCESFFDGCNTCRRMPDGGAGCTRMMCQTYEQPRCLDEESVPSEPESSLSSEDYIGLTIEEAQQLADQRETSFRVVEQDGQPLPATMDWRPGRINARVENGMIVGYDIEGEGIENLPAADPAYDQNSWQEIIPETCESFFDGCNQCQRMDDGGAGCTRMMCQTYEQPRCLDDEENAVDSVPPSDRFESDYDGQSWKDIIPETCMSYFDGCNTCNRAEGSLQTMCTMRACFRYEEPRCLDEE
jgi:hypothetical protein